MSNPFVSPGFQRPGDKPFVNKNGCTITRSFHHQLDRYVFDFKRCSSEDGWEPYDTDQDASYFGVWVRLETFETVTYAEGDITHVVAPSAEIFQVELEEMADFYGSPPPAFRMIDTVTGQLTEVVGARPGEEGPSGRELLAAALAE